MSPIIHRLQVASVVLLALLFTAIAATNNPTRTYVERVNSIQGE